VTLLGRPPCGWSELACGARVDLRVSSFLLSVGEGACAGLGRALALRGGKEIRGGVSISRLPAFPAPGVGLRLSETKRFVASMKLVSAIAISGSPRTQRIGP